MQSHPIGIDVYSILKGEKMDYCMKKQYSTDVDTEQSTNQQSVSTNVVSDLISRSQSNTQKRNAIRYLISQRIKYSMREVINA